MIEKREELIELYDLYCSLLTDKQKNYFEEYYFLDLSISEIAINHEISRNGVFDQIKRVSILLMDYEEKLKLKSKIDQIAQLQIKDEIKEEVINILKE
ncbi:TPA: hypothetical protein IAA91_04155 [Candidatus Avacholeplasma faecigallinarum]|nr:hypothetical protein [Candidatus Avacholeplasma faecigallinarum]